jgi:hypothetical protein
MTTELVGGLLGLFGTALGEGLTTLTSRRKADRSERLAREEARRQEYRSAVIRFATSFLVYRLAEIDYWYSRHGGSEDQGAAEKEVYCTRVTTWNPFYELELSTPAMRLPISLGEPLTESRALGSRAQKSR